jgi:hypothetical protein
MQTLTIIRRWLLIVLSIGLVGTGTELLLIEHYEEPVQLVPIVFIAAALAVVLWHLVKRDAASVRALQGTMLLFLLAGTAGFGYHYRGAAQFQIEIDPSQSRWTIFKKAIRAKAPPVLASGIMLQWGLIGLIYAYRHPALEREMLGTEAMEQ